MTAEKLENFQDAFGSHCQGCVRDCDCGKTFWDSSENDWTWEDGERERLQSDPNAVALNGAVTVFGVEGREYVPECDCWQKRVSQIMGFLDTHAEKIAEYLSLEKKRKQAEASKSPTVY